MDGFFFVKVANNLLRLQYRKQRSFELRGHSHYKKKYNDKIDKIEPNGLCVGYLPILKSDFIYHLEDRIDKNYSSNKNRIAGTDVALQRKNYDN